MKHEKTGYKRPFSTETCYIWGIVLLAFGTALMERADFGVSMVVAPAYLVHLKLRQSIPFFSFGMAEYTFQLLLLGLMCVFLGRLRISYFLSFITAVVYGTILDCFIRMIDLSPWNSLIFRVLYYIVGVLLCAVGVSFLFHTYLPPEAYELFVRECSAHFQIDIHLFKTIYDCASCFLGVFLSFCFFGFGHFEGVKLGTVLCSIVNGSLIGICSRFLEKRFEFYDSYPFRKYFEPEKVGTQ